MRSHQGGHTRASPRQLLDLFVGVEGGRIGLERRVVRFEGGQPLLGRRHLALGVDYLPVGHDLGDEGGAQKQEEESDEGHTGSSKEGQTTLRKLSQPANRASPPNDSSIRSSWLYLAVLSPRAGAPVLI